MTDRMSMAAHVSELDAPFAGAHGRMLYCIVPRDVDGDVREALTRHYETLLPGLEVIVDRRAKRRVATRRSKGASIGWPSPSNVRDREGPGWQLGSLPVDPGSLPRVARMQARRLVLVEQTAEQSEEAEDADVARLVARMQAGEMHLGGVLYQRYSGRVYDYVFSIVRHAADAEDVTQVVFARALEALPDYELRDGAPWRAWLFRIARNAAIDHLRRHARVEVVDPGDARLRDALGVSTAMSEPGWVSDAALQRAIKRLTKLERQVVVLRYGFDLGLAAIGEVLDRTEDTVGKAHRRALDNLRERLPASEQPSRQRCRPLPMTTMAWEARWTMMHSFSVARAYAA